jgi:hypothetical protein
MLLAGREATGGALSILAVGIKLTGGLMLPFALADGGSRRGASGRRELVLGCVIGLGLLAALSAAFFGSGTLHLFSTVGQAQRKGDWLSISGAIREKLGLQTLGLVVGDVLIAGFLLACVWLLARVWRGEIDWVAAAGWATVAMLVASNSLLPWYVGWALPLAALGRDRRLWTAVLGMTGVVLGIELLGSIPHA